MGKQKPTGFADQLRRLREAAGLTQEQLADLAGMHKLGVAKLERGEREPAWATVLALAEALEVSCDAFKPADGDAAAAPTPRPMGRPRKAERPAALPAPPPADDLQTVAMRRGRTTPGGSEKRPRDAELPRPTRGRKGK